MKKMNNFFKLAFLLVALLGSVGQANAQCTPKITITMDRLDCKARLFETDLPNIAPGATVTITKPGVGTVFTGQLFLDQAAFDAAAALCVCSDPGSKILAPAAKKFDGFSYPSNLGLEFVIMYMNTAGTMCFTAVNVKDDKAPIIVPSSTDFAKAIDVTIRCTELNNGKAPLPSAVILGKSVTTSRMPEPYNWSGEPNPFTTIGWTTTTAPGTDPKKRGWAMRDCHAYTASYVDVVPATYDDDNDPLTLEVANVGGPCLNQPVKIHRRWTFKDKWGNANTTFVSADGTLQIITVIYPAIILDDDVLGQVPLTAAPGAAIVGTIAQNAACSKTDASAGVPYIDWNDDKKRDADGKEDVATDGTDYCGTSITLTGSSRPMKPCPNSSMFMRNYKVKYCTAFFNVDHQITLSDEIGPKAAVSYADFSRVPKEQCRTMMVVVDGTMQQMTISEYVYATVKENKTTDIAGDVKGTPGTSFIKITPLLGVGTCGTVKLDFTIKPTDACGGGVTLTANPADPDAETIRFDGMPSMTVAGGTAVRITGILSTDLDPNTGAPDPEPKVFHVIMTDVCGNTTEFKVIVVLIDNLTPNATCSGVDVTLTNSGEALLTPDMISKDPSDNCPLIVGDKFRKLIRRTTPTNDGCWSEQLILTCADLGPDFKVDVRTLDMMGNYNDCCVSVKIYDKEGPSCVMAPQKVVKCTDPTLSDLNALFTQPDAYDNCEVPKVQSVTTTPLSVSCGKGTGSGNLAATRTWVFVDKAGNTTSCFQDLIVNPVLGFRVTALRSITPACGADVPTQDDDKKAILASVKNLHRNNGGTVGTDATAKKDDFDEVTCSAPVLKITEELYMSTEFCKRIIRHYELVDLCATDNVTCGAANTIALGVISADATVTGSKKADITDRELGTDIGGLAAGADAFCKITWSRYITIYDNTPPVADVLPAQEFCVTDNTCKRDWGTVTLTAKDVCGTTPVSAYAYLFYRWEVRKGSTTGDLVASGNGSGAGATNALAVAATSTNGLQGLSFGTYYLIYVVVDDCGNVGQGTPVKVVIKDCKSPYINTHDKNTVLAYSNVTGSGMSVVCATELINSIADNCTSRAYLDSKVKFERASVRTLTGDNAADYAAATNSVLAANTVTSAVACDASIMFNCSDVANSPIAARVWTVDESGNAIFNLVYITVEDNNRACNGPRPQSIVTGTLATETSQAAAKVTLTASASGTIANTTTTDAAGTFSFNVNQAGSYVVKAAKLITDDKYAGVTTFDIARISKHLLDIEKFNSPFQYIAADVDKSGDVDGADMLHIRNFILRKTSSLPGGVWRFLDKSYTFKNPANPFGEDFPEVANLVNSKAAETVNFTAVKLGDVNNTYSANLVSAVVRNSNSLTLNVEDRNLVAGNEYTVNVTAENFNAAAFQGTFGIANATVKSVKAGDLKNYSDGNFGLFSNEFTTSWNGQAKGAAQVFSVTFTANKSGKLSEVMTVGSSLTNAIANDAQGNEMNINLKFSTGKVAGGEFALYNATPNPVATETSIGFNMPKDGAAKMTIYTVEGKTLLVKNIDAKAGLNSVIVNKSDLNASGVLYYRLETADFSATKKMIIIE